MNTSVNDYMNVDNDSPIDYYISTDRIPASGPKRQSNHLGGTVTGGEMEVTNDRSFTYTKVSSPLASNLIAHSHVKHSSLKQQELNNNNMTSSIPHSALATGLVEVGVQGSRIRTRCFLDNGSQITFVSRGIVDDLALPCLGSVSLCISGINQTSPIKNYEVVDLELTMGNITTTTQAIVVDRVPVSIKTPGLAAVAVRLKSLGVKLSDPSVGDCVDDVGVLLGSNVYCTFVLGHKVVADVNLLQTPSGFIIIGPIGQQLNCHKSIRNAVSFQVGANHCPLETINNLNNDEIKLVNNEDMMGCVRLWDLDNLGITDEEVDVCDTLAIERYIKSVAYDGHQYWVNLPFKESKPSLPDNKKAAYVQLVGLLTKLNKEHELLKCYTKVINQLLELDFIEDVSNIGPTGEAHYLPHHGVRKESISTPLRVVFNASSKGKASGDSLNDCLLKGPNLTLKLVDSLLRFRVKKYGFTADISKAFLRVGLKQEDRDYTRFFWKSDPGNVNSRTIIYRFKAVLFGATCSPFLLHATLQHHFDITDSPISSMLANSFYVDNLLGSVNTERELLDIYPEANRVLASANMPLQQWASNSLKLKEIVDKDEEEGMQENIKILGLNWDTKGDTLNIARPEFSLKCNTKRHLLSQISTVYDPLGILNPLTVRARMIMQEVWKLKIDWDEVTPKEIKDSWESLKIELLKVDEIKFNRSTMVESGDLHIFCDASVRAYGAAAYLREGNQVTLLASKCKVAPLKTKTLPQLELTALLIGARMSDWIIETLDVRINNVYLWGDNEAVLQWVRNLNSNKVYVKNRVAEIKQIQSKVKFSTRYIATGENPADLLTRGLSLDQLKVSSLWWKGPHWLEEDSSKWPVQKPYLVSAMEITTEIGPQVESVKKIIDDEKYSDWLKLKNITNCVIKILKIRYPPFASELTAEIYWLRRAQTEHFPLIKELLRGKITKPSNHPSMKMIVDLNLYLDKQDVIRSKGRINNVSIISYGQDLILASPLSHMIELYVRYVHERSLHIGVDQTLATLRQELWIPHARTLIKKVVYNCKTCKRITGPLMLQPGPPQLPADRVRFVRPFMNVGVDYSGAIMIKGETKGNLSKVYICLFTCMASRAVHLEIAPDNTAVTFVNLFRRFVATWGLPVTVTSDNAANFSLTANFLVQLAEDPEVINYFKVNDLKWHFIHPRSPWEGGFYERLIGVTKRCLKLAMHQKTFLYDDIVTLLKEVMTVVNNRPLTYISSTKEEIEPLTPNHLLHGRRIIPLPSLEHDDNETSYENRGQLLEHYENKTCRVAYFTKIWIEQYLASLRDRHYTENRTYVPPVKVGDIVIVENPASREFWPLGVILELLRDSVGIIRSAKVRTRGQVVIKTLNKMVLLEIGSSSEGGIYEDLSVQQHERLSRSRDATVLTPSHNRLDRPSDDVRNYTIDQEPSVSNSTRPSRRAAVKARDKIKLMTNLI